MRDFRRDNRSNRKRTFGKRDMDRPQFYSATCANCGRECEVPFKPTGSKPVLCRDCYRNNNGSDNRNFGRRDNDRPNYDKTPSAAPQPDYQRQLDELNVKVDKILEILSTAMTQAGDEEVKEDFGKEEPVELIENVEEKPKKKATKKKTSPKK